MNQQLSQDCRVMWMSTLGDYTFAYGFARSGGSTSLNNHNEKECTVCWRAFCCPIGVPIRTGRPYSGNGNRMKIPTAASINVATVSLILQTEKDSLCGCGNSFTKMVGVFPIIKQTRCTNFSNLLLEWNSTFNIHGSVHRSNLVVITNEMQLGNGIYYSTVH